MKMVPFLLCSLLGLAYGDLSGETKTKELPHKEGVSVYVAPKDIPIGCARYALYAFFYFFSLLILPTLPFPPSALLLLLLLLPLLLLLLLLISFVTPTGFIYQTLSRVRMGKKPSLH